MVLSTYVYFTIFELILKVTSQSYNFVDTSLVVTNLSIDFPILSFAGSSAIWNKILYGWNGIQCKDGTINNCVPDDKQYTLDISSFNISSGLITTSWKESNLIDPLNALEHGSGGSSSHTYYDNYGWIIHPGCCQFPSNLSLKYNLEDKTYASLDSYNHIISSETLSESCSTTDGLSIYSIGGKNWNIAISNKVYRYHIVNNVWEEIAHLEISRFLCSCTFVNGTLYVLGGQQGFDVTTRLNSIEKYNHINDSWTILSSNLYQARNNHISYRHPNNWIITVGGRNIDNNAADIIEYFEPSTGYIAITNAIYERKQFYSAIYEFNMDTYVIFLYGGNLHGVVYDDIKYIVLSSNDIIFPTNSPTYSPTTNSSDIPTKSPLETNKTHSPTIKPTVSPNVALNIFEPTASPTIGMFINNSLSTTDIIKISFTKTVEIMNQYVAYTMIALVSICGLFLILSLLSHALIYRGCDPPNYFALLWVIMEMYDFFSDVSFSLFLWINNSQHSSLLLLFILSSIFIYIPYFFNLVYLVFKIKKWKRKLTASGLNQWLSYWDWWLIGLAMLTGGCHPSVELCNSLLFPLSIFGMHLPFNELIKIRTERFCISVLLENVPQLFIQLSVLTIYSNQVGVNFIVYVTIISSVGSIAFSALYYCVDISNTITKSQNNWIFRIRLKSNSICKYHKHCYYKLQIAIARALELPDVEWVKITIIRYKIDELRCDGFISIPDLYIKNSEDNKRKINRRASAVYRETFDALDSNLFSQRLETLKEEQSHYHISLIKQLKHELYLNELEIEFEIGGVQKEGAMMMQPILEEEGNQKYMIENNETNYMINNNDKRFGKKKGKNRYQNEIQMINHNELQHNIEKRDEDDVIDENIINIMNTKQEYHPNDVDRIPMNRIQSIPEHGAFDKDIDDINDLNVGSDALNDNIRTDDGVLDKVIESSYLEENDNLIIDHDNNRKITKDINLNESDDEEIVPLNNNSSNRNNQHDNKISILQ